MYALVDCNSFFASCERVFRPDLRNTPLVVLSNNDGCVVAHTKEVTTLNLPPFVAHFKVKHILEAHKVVAFSSNYELYADLSMRVMQTLAHFGRDISIYSIDEAFLDLTGDKKLISTGSEIKKTVQKNIGLPVSVGIGKTKTLAKLANHIAKRSKKCNGVCLLENTQHWENIFKRIAVSEIWGVGRRLEKRLAHLNIYTVYDFMQVDGKYLRRHFGVNMERTWKELHGENCLYFHDDIETPKQIYRTRSFGNKTSLKEHLQASITMHIGNAMRKARKHDLLVKSMLVFIETSRHIKNPYRNHAITQFAAPTNDTRQLLKASHTLIDKIYKPNYSYYKAGVGLIELCAAKNFQQDIFSPADDKKSQNLMHLIDYCHQRGEHLHFARNVHKSKHPHWKMRREHKSPCYTTRFDELPIVYAK